MAYKEIELMKAIEEINFNKVLELISKGANVNFNYSKSDYPEGIIYEIQPYSPLRMVVFRASDSTISFTHPEIKNPFLTLDNIAKILIENGADLKDAYNLIKERYGSNYPSIENSINELALNRIVNEFLKINN